MLWTAAEPLQAHEQKQQGRSAAVGFSFLSRRTANPNDALPVNEIVTIENATANNDNNIDIGGNSDVLPYCTLSPVTDMGMVETRTTANKAPSVPSTKTLAMAMMTRSRTKTARAAAAQMARAHSDSTIDIAPLRPAVATNEIVATVMRVHRKLGHANAGSTFDIVACDLFGIPKNDVKLVVNRCPDCLDKAGHQSSLSSSSASYSCKLVGGRAAA
jgi:hypothetical protein